MAEKQLYAEIVESGTWLYDNQVPHESGSSAKTSISIMKKGYEDGPEQLNPDGELFNLVFAFQGTVRTVGPAKMSLSEAILEAEKRLIDHQLD